MEQQQNIAHRSRHSGPSKEKKKAKTSTEAQSEKSNNVKGFGVGRRAEKYARRSADVGERKLHVPQVDRTPEEAPPIIIAVVGPPGVRELPKTCFFTNRY